MKNFIYLTISFGEKIAVNKNLIESVRVVDEERTEVILASGKAYVVSEFAESILFALGGAQDLPNEE